MVAVVPADRPSLGEGGQVASQATEAAVGVVARAVLAGGLGPGVCAPPGGRPSRDDALLGLPVARSSFRARSANAAAPIASKISYALLLRRSGPDYGGRRGWYR